MQSIIHLINSYGYIIIFTALTLELIAFPLPGEIMMTYCGFLVYQTKMNWLISIIAASAGTILGITFSYFIGRVLGIKFFRKYGSYIHLGPDKLDKTSYWFNTYGNRLLILAYFIPGVRHITGYFSGIARINYKKFSLNAYLGAIIWASTFISLGKFLGPNWDKFHVYIKKYLVIGCIIIALILTTIYILKNHRNQVIAFIYTMLNRGLTTFNSMRKIKLAVASISIIFLCLFALVIGLIQDYLANDFKQFDAIVFYLVKAVYPENLSLQLGLFDSFSSIQILAPLTILLILWIIAANEGDTLEIKFLLIVVCGGELLQFLLRHIFGLLVSSYELTGIARYTFPDKESLLSLAVYGFIAYILSRHVKRSTIRTFFVLITIIICIFAGLNQIFLETEYPSAVYAGYVFGGAWLTLNILLLEIYQILPKIRNNK